MVRLLLIIVVGLYSMSSNAQIEIFNESLKQEEPVKVVQYDSIRNITSQPYGTKGKESFTYNHLIGQTLMFCGSPIFPNNNFKVGSYYKVVETTMPNSISIYGGLKLEDCITGNFLEEDGSRQQYLNSFWVVVGYYEKLKALYLNKKFIYLGTDKTKIYSPGLKKNGMINLATDTVTENIKKESLWTCVGVQVKPEKAINRENPSEYRRIASDYRNPVVLIFDNPNYGKHYCYIESEKGKPYEMQNPNTKPFICGRFQLKSDFDYLKVMAAKRKAQLIKLYGAKNANLIVQGIVNIGMTNSMCRAAWGDPDSIHRTISVIGNYELWIYGNCYLYFKDNSLTTIQY